MITDLEKSEQPHFSVADIFRKHIGEYKKSHRLSYEQHKAVSAIMGSGRIEVMCSILSR